MSKELSEMCPLGEKMAKIWLKLQENGEKKSQMAKVMAKEKYILARTLCDFWAPAVIRVSGNGSFRRNFTTNGIFTSSTFL